jgi:hypothetical protein
LRPCAFALVGGLHEVQKIAHEPDFFLCAGDSGEGQSFAIRRSACPLAISVHIRSRYSPE